MQRGKQGAQRGEQGAAPAAKGQAGAVKERKPISLLATLWRNTFRGKQKDRSPWKRTPRWARRKAARAAAGKRTALVGRYNARVTAQRQSALKSARVARELRGGAR